MTAFEFRRRSAHWLLAIVVASVLLFGGVDAWALALIVAAIFALASAWAWQALRGRSEFVWSRFYIPLAIVPAIAAVQLAGGVPHPYATIGELVKWLAYLAFFALAVDALDDRWIRRRFGRWLAGFGYFVSVLALVQHYTSPEMAYWFREAPGGSIFGPFADRNHFAVLIELLFPGAIMLAIAGSERRLFYFVLCALMYASVIACGSRTGFALVTVEFLVILGFRLIQAARMRRKEAAREIVSSVGFAAVLLLGVLAAGFTGLAERFSQRTEQSGLARVGVAATTWEMFLERPGLGHGLGSFQAVFPSRAAEVDGVAWHHAHCDPIQLPMEIGAAGFLVQLLVLGGMLTLRRSGRLWISAGLPLAAAWTHSWVEFPLQMPSLVLVALSLLALYATGRDRRRRRADGSSRDDLGSG